MSLSTRYPAILKVSECVKESPDSNGSSSSRPPGFFHIFPWEPVVKLQGGLLGPVECLVPLKDWNDHIQIWGSMGSSFLSCHRPTKSPSSLRVLMLLKILNILRAREGG
jgi:hypothetical protein